MGVFAALLLASPGEAAAQSVRRDGTYLPGEVIVRYHAGTTPAAQARLEATTATHTLAALPGGSKRLQVEDGQSVDETVSELRHDPNVAYAVPNYTARASAFYPNDPSLAMQWNFTGPFGINMPDQLRRAGAYVDLILKGAKPAQLPIQLPTRYDMVINTKTAKALGLTVPPSLLARADELIE